MNMRHFIQAMLFFWVWQMYVYKIELLLSPEFTTAVSMMMLTDLVYGGVTYFFFKDLFNEMMRETK